MALPIITRVDRIDRTKDRRIYFWLRKYEGLQPALHPLIHPHLFSILSLRLYFPIQTLPAQYAKIPTD